MPLSFQYHQLPNGLDVVIEHNPDAHSTAAGLFVKAGSRDETPGINGVSHFLEHMMFKGSHKYTWEDVNRIFDELGARYNAYTTQEMTAYYANVLPEFTERAIEHLSHLLRPAIRQSDFDTEKNVILEEIAMYLDEPGQRVYERVMAEHFGSHPLGMSVIGTAEIITALQRDQMEQYFRSRYGPGNMVLSVTGRLDPNEIIALAEKHFGHWEHLRAPPHYQAPRLGGRVVDLDDPKLNKRYAMGLTPGPSAQDDRRFAARVLSDIIGDSEGSRLYWALVDPAIADDADFGFYPHDQCGSFYLSLTTAPERYAEALAIARKEIARVHEDLGDDEVERARNKIASSIVLSGEQPMGRMRAIGTNWIYNQAYRSLEDDMQALMSVSTASLRELLDAYRFSPMTIVSLGPPGSRAT
ncbi:MAG TPA: pitrilysin family protein [Tepidisphaeraceae bacterium]|nr:pitrilysin family protein [Tepidisphaeraceae bacterium]